MGDTKFGALVLIAVIGFIVAGLPAALADGAQTETVTNESLTVDYGNESTVSLSGVTYSDTVEIVANDTTLEDGTDYEWNSTIGNVTWIDTSATSDGDDALINYSVDQVTAESQQYADVLSILVLPLALLITLLLGLSAIGGIL